MKKRWHPGTLTQGGTPAHSGIRARPLTCTIAHGPAPRTHCARSHGPPPLQALGVELGRTYPRRIVADRGADGGAALRELRRASVQAVRAVRQLHQQVGWGACGGKQVGTYWWVGRQAGRRAGGQAGRRAGRPA